MKRMKIPLHKMTIQNINDKMKEGCGIIASKQPPKSGFIRLVIKKSVKGINVSGFYNHIIYSTSNYDPPIIIKCKWFQIIIL